jgi:hypothetical protein
MKKSFSILLFIVLILSTTVSFASDTGLKTMTDAQLLFLQSELAAEIASRNLSVGTTTEIASLQPSNGTSAQVGAGETTAQIGNATLTVKGARMSKDYDGKDCIVITYEWSHQKEEAESFMFYFADKVFQGGIQLERAIMADGVDSSPSMLDIRAGTALEVEKAYVLRDTTTSTELEVKKLTGSNGTGKLETTFTLPL